MNSIPTSELNRRNHGLSSITFGKMPNPSPTKRVFSIGKLRSQASGKHGKTLILQAVSMRSSGILHGIASNSKKSSGSQPGHRKSPCNKPLPPAGTRSTICDKKMAISLTTLNAPRRAPIN